MTMYKWMKIVARLPASSLFKAEDARRIHRHRLHLVVHFMLAIVFWIVGPFFYIAIENRTRTNKENGGRKREETCIKIANEIAFLMGFYSSWNLLLKIAFHRAYGIPSNQPFSIVHAISIGFLILFSFFLVFVNTFALFCVWKSGENIFCFVFLCFRHLMLVSAIFNRFRSYFT